MNSENKPLKVSSARQERRDYIVSAAKMLLGSKIEKDFDPVHSSLCPVDVLMVAGAPWLRDGLERDFFKDESGYRKIGGGANTPAMPYFFRSAINLMHYLKRQGFYFPRGTATPAKGMACFFDWEDRGRFNFTPDRCGVITNVIDEQIVEVVLAVQDDNNKNNEIEVRQLKIVSGDHIDRALIGYSDLP